jgi:hypothetical protein
MSKLQIGTIGTPMYSAPLPSTWSAFFDYSNRPRPSLRVTNLNENQTHSVVLRSEHCLTTKRAPLLLIVVVSECIIARSLGWQIAFEKPA